MMKFQFLLCLCIIAIIAVASARNQRGNARSVRSERIEERDEVESNDRVVEPPVFTEEEQQEFKQQIGDELQNSNNLEVTNKENSEDVNSAVVNNHVEEESGNDDKRNNENVHDQVVDKVDNKEINGEQINKKDESVADNIDNRVAVDELAHNANVDDKKSEIEVEEIKPIPTPDVIEDIIRKDDSNTNKVENNVNVSEDITKPTEEIVQPKIDEEIVQPKIDEEITKPKVEEEAAKPKPTKPTNQKMNKKQKIQGKNEKKEVVHNNNVKQDSVNQEQMIQPAIENNDTNNSSDIANSQEQITNTQKVVEALIETPKSEENPKVIQDPHQENKESHESTNDSTFNKYFSKDGALAHYFNIFLVNLGKAHKQIQVYVIYPYDLILFLIFGYYLGKFLGYLKGGSKHNN